MGLSLTHLLVVLVIVVLLFGTRKMRSLGSDLGNAIKGFRDSLSDNKDAGADVTPDQKLTNNEQRTASGEPAKSSDKHNV